MFEDTGLDRTNPSSPPAVLPFPHCMDMHGVSDLGFGGSLFSFSFNP
jgi:hypothetical protein